MLTGLAALELTDWTKLLHAYGRAGDTPGHLRALLTADAGARKGAMDHLWSAVIHQGTPWTVTGPAAMVVAGVLWDPRIGEVQDALRAGLIAFLGAVAAVAAVSSKGTKSLEELRETARYDIDPLLESDDHGAVYEDEEAANSLYARSILGCVEVAPELMKAILQGLNDPDHGVRMEAVAGATRLYRIPSIAREAEDFPVRLLSRAMQAGNLDERCTCILALGNLDCSPVQFLEDPSPAVRMCAALAPALAKDERALAELIRLLREHASEIDTWFTDRPPQFWGHPRFAVVTRLAWHLKDFDRLVDAAIAVVGVAAKQTVDRDWGPLLAAAFPEGDGVVRTDSQRRYLRALTDRADLWDPRYGNAELWFKKAGLPYDRKECRKRLGAR
jgi:hypothetical protein